jgi:putative tricarboxylic transport membrane protein
MDQLQSLLQGFGDALTPVNLMWAFIGVTIGTAVGVLPGIGPALTVAMLLPITFRLEPASALIMFAGIYYGGMYGGSTSAPSPISCSSTCWACWAYSCGWPTSRSRPPSSR